jgi:putative ABC transport system permease protein
MFKNYIKIAFRNLWKNKGFSAIIILGLATGLATCLLIALFVTDEFRYDKFNAHANRIFRLNADFSVNGSDFKERQVPAQFGPVLMKDNPQVENYVRLSVHENILVKKGDETLIEPNACFADSSLFDVFTLPMVAGNPKTALTRPGTIVISERIALKYLKSIDVIGKTLLTDNIYPFQISGVIRNVPDQSHIHFDFIRSMASMNESREDNWLGNNFVTYLLVRPGIDATAIQGYLRAATKKYMESELKKVTGITLNDLEAKGGHFRYAAVPLTDIHLHSTLTNEAEPSGNITYVYIFMAVGAIILLIACVNFMNLSTARSAGRAKEVGVRKVLGSPRSGLIFQFLTESLLTSFLALVLAVMMAILLLPFFNELTGKHIRLDKLSDLWLLPVLIITGLVVGLLAGSYPAFFLAAFEPIKVLKGKLRTGFKGGWIRNSLVVFQFTSAILLIVGTLVIYNQLSYIRNKTLGYNREQVLILQNTSSLWVHAKTFKNEVLQLPGVESGTMTNSLPTKLFENTGVYSKEATSSGGQSMALGEWYIDTDYFPTLGMKMAAGRNFSPQFSTDTNALVINETAARLLGFSDVNDKFLYNNMENAQQKIIGIVKDFNAGSLRNKIKPMVFRLGEYRNNMAFRIKTAHITGLIAKIKNTYAAQDGMSGQPFVYSFLDDDFNRLYQAEQRTGKIFISLAVLAIFIASLGVFGLITYAAEQRTKEIGIRKVLGSSVTAIVMLLSKDFLKLVFIGFIIATPISWFMMNKWLQGFAYRINISWAVFLLAALLAILVTLVSIGFQAIKAATANPVKSLKSE